MDIQLQKETFKVRQIFSEIDDYLHTGDPIIREWFLINSKFWPAFLCTMYLIVVKIVGPAFMRDRKPFVLRKTLIVYNLFLVITYSATIYVFMANMVRIDPAILCKNSNVNPSDSTYTLAACGWMVYMLKYVEFLDTIFFVLRKKDKSITNLHVIHHAILPICGWVLFRTETSGFQSFPVLLNSIVHVLMYSYYGLAAIGPHVQKYLWWKRYLTIIQMVQFILVILFVTTITPLSGCSAAKTSVWVNTVLAVLFLILFYNFYTHSFQPKGSQLKKDFEKKQLEGDVSKHNNNEAISETKKFKSN
ncbi:elongation of very long chain fatty acids protein 7-like isoform X2 [Stegodyphus dumicola]|nr:elongation of very long chain fatty acids protein 7-like isoform X2 [Stegodyphus dumicola]XP_035214325.1 elongation of very long chain fatty acids protein 7-like isoform X2 [Stegodyphus dumicola]